MNETVSVIVPNRNMGHFVDAALRSIECQKSLVKEVVCVDCNSSDESTAVIGSFEGRLPICLKQCSDLSPAAARNVGLKHASGDYIAFLDSDDLWPPGKLERQLRRLSSQPFIQMVSGYVRYFEHAAENGMEPEIGSRTEDLFHVHVGACVYRKEFLDRIGYFDEDFIYSEDVDLMLRVRESREPFSILRSPELYYRRHPASMMAQTDPRKEYSLKLAAQKSLIRRRRAGSLGTPLPDFSCFLEPV